MNLYIKNCTVFIYETYDEAKDSSARKNRVLQQQMMIMFLQTGRQLRHWQLDDHLKMLQVWFGGYFWSGQYE